MNTPVSMTMSFLFVALTVAACDPRANPDGSDAISVAASQLPPLNVIQHAKLDHPYSCHPAGQLTYEGSALFLSAYSKQLNAPDLLYNGACGSVDYLGAATAGDDFALIADLGDVPLESVTAHKAFNYPNVAGFDNTFVREAPVVEGHTYVVLISKREIRALFVVHVDGHVPDGSLSISYAVKSYLIQETVESSPGFGWEIPSSEGTATTPSTARIQGTVSVAGACASSDPARDCRGVLVIGVIDRPAPLPQATMLGSMIIPAADLSGGRSVSYDIAGLPSGAAYIAAMLVETGSPSAPPYPSAGDLVLAPHPLQLQPGTTTLALTLSDRWP